MKTVNAIKKLEAQGYNITKIFNKEEYLARKTNSREIIFCGDDKGEVNSIKVGLRYLLSIAGAIKQSSL